jgi:hypothetical protein
MPACVPWMTRRVTPMTYRLAAYLTTWANRDPSGRTGRGRPRRPVWIGWRKTVQKAVT